MNRIKPLLAFLFVVSAILACYSPQELISQLANSTATTIAQNQQALAPTISKTPLATPLQASGTPSSLLPHSLYYLNNDKAGLLQVFRLDRDGQTVHQITFEPVNVDSYDVSSKDGSLVYVSNNQLIWVDINGAGRRILLDGGPLNENNKFANAISNPIWSPDGQTIAFGHGGLNFYIFSSGVTNNLLQNQIDTSAGFPMVRQLYSPIRFSPDGTKLLINVTFFEGGTIAIFVPTSNALLSLHRPDGGNVCCKAFWVPDGSGLYLASPYLGMIESGLYYVNASTGEVTILLPGSAPDGTYNFADAPQVGPDGKLYFFFNNLKEIPTGHTPLLMVRSNSDGVTDRTQLLPKAFENTNEILWAPDASLAVVAFAPTPDVYQGGQAVIEYPDGRPEVVLANYAFQMRWGP